MAKSARRHQHNTWTIPWARLMAETEKAASGTQVATPLSQNPGLQTQELPMRVLVLGQVKQLVAEPLQLMHLKLQTEQTLIPLSKKPLLQGQVVPLRVLLAGQLSQVLVEPTQLRHS